MHTVTVAESVELSLVNDILRWWRGVDSKYGQVGCRQNKEMD